mmetsp:Transcript_12300/g.18637  ORF Transcript_12300/g.18637 Transcript_12300/m.18637 type:complete len:391 (+) Transcript_12300:63-1235(+)|eukprot:CAMPEP_0185023454 /NCGR_PEP_ID=MMETSP1103-20130426/6124_1 /TAXON_ID=36769 /ORGANISM="Paraphysomonas bandaiensis, Strain Caron Lab Isolate" /LENGTH=390 /DNA_ID=CAMNT_0027556057 /DNA_START=79 /DNA_END=1251 /DNA_ORIENTATION=+
MGKKLSKPGSQTEGDGAPAPEEESSGPVEDVPIGNEFSHVNNKPLTIDDFELLKVLGKGSFGKVMLVKKKDDTNETLYALKTLRKAALVKRNQLAHTATERVILQNIRSPFLVHLVYAFQTPDKLYMVLDYMAGGELFFWLKKDRRFSEERCRLYTAEITCALEALHSVNIIYRDLKPENILLDAVGHIRLTDFGLSKGDIAGPGAEGGTKTFCGTPEYLAPEILENRGHGKAVDWWSLGTLLYEMLCGLPPFYDTNVQRMYHKILHNELKFPKSNSGRQVSAAAKNILTGLLERKVADRLGSGPTDAAELKQTEFLSVLDFDRVMDKGYEPEFRPPAQRDESDVRNFDKEFTEEHAVDSVVTSHMTGSMTEKTNFEGFTYQGDKNMGSG